MKKIFLALMVVAAIAIVGCKERHEVNDPTDPEAPENKETTRYIQPPSADSTVFTPGDGR